MPVPEDLTTLPFVKTVMQDESTDSDNLYTQLIPVASSMVRAHTKRRFTKPKAVEERGFYLYQHGNVYLDEAWSDGTFTVVDSYGDELDFEVRPETFQPEKGVWLMFPSIQNNTWEFVGDQYKDHFTRNMHGLAPFRDRRRRGERITVSTEWGYETYPEELQYQTARVIEQWVKGGLGEFTTSFAQGQPNAGIPFEVPKMLPTVVQNALRDWMIPRTARTMV